MTRFIRKMTVAAIAGSMLAAAGASQVSAAQAAPIPGVLGVDHMGITVPNAAKARR